MLWRCQTAWRNFHTWSIYFVREVSLFLLHIEGRFTAKKVRIRSVVNFDSFEAQSSKSKSRGCSPARLRDGFRNGIFDQSYRTIAFVSVPNWIGCTEKMTWPRSDFFLDLLSKSSKVPLVKFWDQTIHGIHSNMPQASKPPNTLPRAPAVADCVPFQGIFDQSCGKCFH